MNRLWGNLAYLIGSIDVCPDNGRTWRKNMEVELLKRNIIPLNPMDKPIDIGDENKFREQREKYKNNKDYESLSENVKIIRHVDLRLVDKASFVIFYLDLSINACGSWEECFWANRLKSPVIVVCKQGKQKIPDWLFGALKEELFFDNFEDALKYIDYIDSDTDPETLGRWLFVSYRDLYSKIGVISDGRSS